VNLICFHLVSGTGAEGLKRGSFWVVITSMGLAAAGTVGVLFDIDALKVLGFPVGAVLWVAARVQFGVATTGPAWWPPTSD
jgi:hypothetical protein